MKVAFGLIAILALLGCDRASTAEGPGTETETVTLVRADGKPLVNATVRQIADIDWLERIRSGRGVVLDTCLTDSAGTCSIASRPGVVWEAVSGDSLFAWSTKTDLVAKPTALWTGADAAGTGVFLARTSVQAKTSPAGVWATCAPQGAFATWRRSGTTFSPGASVVLDSSTMSWDTTKSLGTVVSIMDSTSPFRIDWRATVLESPSGLRVVDPTTALGFETSNSECVGICPILQVVAGGGASVGLAGRIRVGSHIVGVVGGATLHIRMNSTAPFQTLVRGLGRDSAVGSTTWMPNNSNFDSQWVVYRTTGGLDTLSLESTNIGTITVLDVQIRDSTGVKFRILR